MVNDSRLKIECHSRSRTQCIRRTGKSRYRSAQQVFGTLQLDTARSNCSFTWVNVNIDSRTNENWFPFGEIYWTICNQIVVFHLHHSDASLAQVFYWMSYAHFLSISPTPPSSSPSSIFCSLQTQLSLSLSFPLSFPPLISFLLLLPSSGCSSSASAFPSLFLSIHPAKRNGDFIASALCFMRIPLSTEHISWLKYR